MPVVSLLTPLSEKDHLYTTSGMVSHLLRHSSLTALSKAGWKPEHLRVRAGHAQFQYTYQLYVHPDDEELRQAWERTEAHLHLHGSLQEQEGICSQR